MRPPARLLLDDTRLPLTAHLTELRTRLTRAIVAIIIGAGASWAFREEIFAFLLRPALVALAPDGGRLQALAPGEMFFTYMKCSLLVGFVVALPVLFWEIWGFVAPGLYPSEKRLAFPFVLMSTLLFLGGAAFGYEVVFPLMFTFFAAFENQYVQAAWTMREVFSFTVHMFLAFGIAFELPVGVFFLSLAGILDPRQLLRGFKYAVLGAFVASAVLTPTPDIVTQTLLAGPLIILYLLGVGAAWLLTRKKAAAAEAEDEPDSTPTIV